MKQILIMIMIAFCVSACNDWLDVRPDTEQKEEDQFSTTGGFYDALIGCYMSMADADAYGERLTISNVESLTGIWYMPEEASSVSASRLGDFELSRRNYTGDNAKEAISAMYSALFNVIAQANMIIKYADENADVFVDKTALSMVKGEAYAIRAYCQFDILRLFGQLPVNPQKQVALPYSFTTSIYEMPAYYDFDNYVKLLKEDLKQAEDCLKENDPIFKYTFDELNKDADVPDDRMLFRQSRLNYWAVKALQARVYLYLNERSDAARIAGEIMNAKGVDGASLIGLSGRDNFAKGYKLCPDECLFYLSKYDIMSATESFLLGKTDNAHYGSNSLVVDRTRYDLLYAGVDQASNRYQNCWNRNVASSTQAGAYVATAKYWWKEDIEDQTRYFQLVPMLRMSEIYLIAMESSDNLSDVNKWYKEYSLEQGIGSTQDFVSFDEAKKWIKAEYCREFFVEGQAFYTYKRLSEPKMLGSDKTVGETEYILPLPATEFNPNNL